MPDRNYPLRAEEHREHEGHADAGLAGIAARFAADAGPIGVAAEAGAAVNGAGGGGHGHRRRDLVTADDVWVADLQPATLNAAGTLDLGSEWGPTTGFALRLTEVVITLLTGTTLVQIYKNGVTPVALRFQTSATGLWEPSRMYLLYGERLIVVSTGGGVILVPDGERIATHFLPTYLA